MRKTSFGSMQTLLGTQSAPLLEHLIFKTPGRPHQHLEYETVAVLKGSGVIITSNNKITARPGSLITIPPKTRHYMVPGETEEFEILVWYHPQNN